MPVPRSRKPASISWSLPVKASQANEDEEDTNGVVPPISGDDANGPDAELIQRFEDMLQKRDAELFRRLDTAFSGFFGSVSAMSTSFTAAYNGPLQVNHMMSAATRTPTGNVQRRADRIGTRSKALMESKVRKLAAHTKKLSFPDLAPLEEQEDPSKEPDNGSSERESACEDSQSRLQRLSKYCGQNVVGCWWFEGCFMAAIMLHSVTLGVQIDLVATSAIDPTLSLALEWIQHWFALMFWFELMIRWLAEGRAFLWNSSNLIWNWLDFFLVVTSLVEIVGEIVVAFSSDEFAADLSLIGNMRVIRIVRISRLLRVLRIVRVVRFVRSLRNLVSSIAMTFRSLAWSVILLVIIIYMFGVLLTDGVADFLRNEEGTDAATARDLQLYFGSVHDAMHTLFRSIANGISWDVVIRPLIQASWFWGYVYSLYVVFTTFAVLNVITAVFCQSTIEGAARDKELLAESHMLNKERYYLLVEDLFKNLQSDESGKVTLQDFEDHFNDVEVRAFFHGLDLEPSDAWVLFSLLDDDGSGDIDAEEFVEGLLRLKGPARAIDLAAIGRDCKSCTKRVYQTGERIHRMEALLLNLIHLWRSGDAVPEGADTASTSTLFRVATESAQL